ncbi:Ankyrin-1 [Verticillium dahliae VDG2]|nr:Ankyrin-1 [Verticillium dahliae VDG2]
MSSSTETLRRTRFVLISDTHNHTPALPRGDVLVHAGDLTNQGSYSELSRVVQWLEKADFESKIVVAGNHDLNLDPKLVASRGSSLADSSHTHQDCLNLLLSSPSITYLAHASTTIRLSSPEGPHTTFTAFGSPFSPLSSLHGSFSAFTYASPLHPLTPTTAADLPSLWDAIPLDADARGAERVLWDLSCGNVAFKETSVEQWVDPAPEGKKLSILSLGSRGGKPLRNDGGRGTWAERDDAVTQPSTAAMQSGVPGAAMPHIGTRGLGGDPSSARSDGEALAGRLGRLETCVVNCAIMAKSYPHVGGRKMNKPIVVDLDLPVW